MVVFELADKPGGQVRLTAQSKRRAEMIGIIDWRLAQCQRLGVEFRFNTWAEHCPANFRHKALLIAAEL